MRIFKDKNDRYFVLLPDVLKHILAGHPEMSKYLKEIEETLLHPIVIYQSKKFSERHLYYRRFRNKLLLVVVVDILKGIIKTSYISDKIKEGKLIWQETK